RGGRGRETAGSPSTPSPKRLFGTGDDEAFIALAQLLSQGILGACLPQVALTALLPADGSDARQAHDAARQKRRLDPLQVVERDRRLARAEAKRPGYLQHRRACDPRQWPIQGGRR